MTTKGKMKHLTNCILKWKTKCIKCERDLLPGWKAFRKKQDGEWVTWCTKCRSHELMGGLSPQRPGPGRRARFVTGRR